MQSLFIQFRALTSWIRLSMRRKPDSVTMISIPISL
jgi:hypothetical protein